ncbi:MAG: PEGA domain-containing protein, partial [Polyangiaceae bacterium]|nr:PEGA domain-containing protein [Polyangiaceae bacterium]
ESDPAGADVALDDTPLATPTPADVSLPPGTHKVRFSAKGRVAVEKAVDVAFASSQTVSVALQLEPPPPAPPPPVAVVPPPAVPAAVPAPPAEPRSKLPAYITGGLAIAAAGVGTAFGVLALNDKSRFDKNPTTATADQGDTHALIADMAFGVAVTFAATAIVLFLTRDDAPPANASAGAARPVASGDGESAPSRKERVVSVVPTPVVGPHTAGAGFVLQF